MEFSIKKEMRRNGTSGETRKGRTVMEFRIKGIGAR